MKHKNAGFRYHVLDSCFRNMGRKFFIEDLVNACNQYYQEEGYDFCVQKRQVQNDITHMENTYIKCELQRNKEGKRVWYRYSDPNFSIGQMKINLSNTEINQIKEVFKTLSGFRGLPQFSWLEEILLRLDSSMKIDAPNYVYFDQTPYYIGLEFIKPLFEAIIDKKLIRINYHSFSKKTKELHVLHPFFLRQYNHRWYVIGYSELTEKVVNLALDRILEIDDQCKGDFIEKMINYEEYYEDVVGVTILDKPVEKVLIWIHPDRYPYLRTRPWHGSQKKISESEKGVEIEFELIINVEFKMLLLSFGTDVKVQKPLSLQREMAEIFTKGCELYKTPQSLQF